MTPEELTEFAKNLHQYDDIAIKEMLLEAAKKISELEDTLRAIEKSLRLM